MLLLYIDHFFKREKIGVYIVLGVLFCFLFAVFFNDFFKCKDTIFSQIKQSFNAKSTTAVFLNGIIKNLAKPCGLKSVGLLGW